MRIEAIQTRVLIPPQDDLLSVLDESLPQLSEQSVIVISSKVVAIWQARCIPIPEDGSQRTLLKEALAKQEADLYLEKETAYPFTRLFTVYEGILGSVAGIDESNGNHFFILLPKHSAQAARDIRAHLMKRHAIRECGVVISDSRSAPMRNGVTALALGHAGFEALYDYRGTEDIFGRPMKYERMNIADSVATAANLVIGEGSECTPLALCTDLSHLRFTDAPSDDFMLRPNMAMEDDVFAQFFTTKPWKQGGA